ncbi:MAG: segregation/condensation protein A, partial [Planctomycetes bacterium]|nr:segregation/condensation protein A [Planctomycetota bacterium]
LLLYLISREEVDIEEISIARIVDQYMAYLQQLRDLDVEITSDFIVMASTLMLLKSKALLPTEEINLEEDIDQQDELIQHLLEYKKVKMLSRALDEAGLRHSLQYPRPGQPGLVEEPSLSEEEVNLWDILRAFSKIIKETGLDRRFQVIHSEKPISDYLNAILAKLEKNRLLPFDSLFTGEKTRNEAICHFIGLLELMRRRIITVHAAGDKGFDLEVRLRISDEELEGFKKDGEFQIELLGSNEEDGEVSIPGDEGPASETRSSGEMPSSDDVQPSDEEAEPAVETQPADDLALSSIEVQPYNESEPALADPAAATYVSAVPDPHGPHKPQKESDQATAEGAV